MYYLFNCLFRQKGSRILCINKATYIHLSQARKSPKALLVRMLLIPISLEVILYVHALMYLEGFMTGNKINVSRS